MKWNNNGITYRRGYYGVLIAQYDGKGAWYCNATMMTQQSTIQEVWERMKLSIDFKEAFDRITVEE